jgi:hypothetical protein
MIQDQVNTAKQGLQQSAKVCGVMPIVSSENWG